MGEYQSKSTAVNDRLVENSPKTNSLPSWKNILEGNLRTGRHKRRLCKDEVVETSNMALEGIYQKYCTLRQ